MIFSYTICIIHYILNFTHNVNWILKKHKSDHVLKKIPTGSIPLEEKVDYKNIIDLQES